MRPLARSIATLCVAALLAACAASRPPAADLGSFDGNAYENREFGFRVVLPTGWIFLTREQVDVGIKEELEKGPANSESARDSIARTRTLFSMFDLASMKDANSIPRTLTASRESFEGIASGMTSETYAAAARMAIETTDALNAEFGKWRHETLAGQDFVVLPTVIDVGESRARQDVYVRVVGTQALSFIALYPASEAGSLREALETIQPLP